MQRWCYVFRVCSHKLFCDMDPRHTEETKVYSRQGTEKYILSIIITIIIIIIVFSIKSLLRQELLQNIASQPLAC